MNARSKALNDFEGSRGVATAIRDAVEDAAPSRIVNALGMYLASVAGTEEQLDFILREIDQASRAWLSIIQEDGH